MDVIFSLDTPDSITKSNFSAGAESQLFSVQLITFPEADLQAKQKKSCTVLDIVENFKNRKRKGENKNMFYGRVCGKVIRRKNKNGYSYNFIIAKNQRNPMSGKPEYQVVWNFGTIKDSEFNQNALSFWKEVAMVVANLINEQKIYSNCGSEIKAKFQKYIPIPIEASSASVPIVKPKANSDAAERLRERFNLQ